MTKNKKPTEFYRELMQLGSPKPTNDDDSTTLKGIKDTLGKMKAK